MKKPSGPLLYIGQPQLKPVIPVMQEVSKADEPLIVEAVPKTEAKKEEPKDESGRLKPFREMDTAEKVLYLAKRRIPVPCRFEWTTGSARGIIERYDENHVWVIDDETKTAVEVPLNDILHIRIAGT